MSTLLAPILKHIRDLARCAQILGSDEAVGLTQIADRLERFGIGGDDLIAWLKNETELEAAADELNALLRRNYKPSDRDLVRVIAELLTLVRNVRARVVEERLPQLSESIAEGPPGVLRDLIIEHGVATVPQESPPVSRDRF